MAKPKPNTDEPVSLFPFLSILACLIGVLTFIITGVAISQMDESEDIAAAERTEKYTPIAEKLEQDRARLAELKKAHAAADALEQQLKTASAERDRLSKLKADAERAKKAKQLMSQIARVDQSISQARPKVIQLKTQIKQTQDQLNERKKEPGPAGTIVRPGGSGINLRPHFIECQHGQIVIHEAGKRTPIRNDKLKTDARFLGLLDRIAKLEKERVIFLVRPNSVGTYNAASAIARVRQCRYGKLPVPGEGPIDLSPFKKK